MIKFPDFKKKWHAAMEDLGEYMVEELRDKLTQEHGYDLGDLSRSIKVVRVTDDEITIEMDKTGAYLEYGTAPHFPPYEELIGWVRRKWGGRIRQDRRTLKKQKRVKKLNFEQQYRSAAFALAVHISRVGTKPYPFITKTYNHDFIPALKKALKKNF